MKLWKSDRLTVLTVLTGIAASFALGVLPGAVSPAGAAPITATTQSTTARQYLGTPDRPTTYTPTVKASGTYVVEFQVDGVSFYNTEVDGTELGWTGGSFGSYSTRSFHLSAGKHTVTVIGPEGYGTVKVYLVRVS